MASEVRASFDEPCSGMFVWSPYDLDGGFGPAQKLLQTGLDHGPLGVGVGAQLLEPAADVGLELRDAPVEARHPLVVLALQRLRCVGEPALEPLRARVADVRETLGE